MLAAPVPRKEAVMSEQLLLFSREKPAWMERFWEGLDSRERREVIALFAQMASDALTPRQEKEQSHER
jgi:hypothetical protein